MLTGMLLEGPPATVRPGARPWIAGLTGRRAEGIAWPMSETQPHVLFVCTGNTCRSPMAELLMRRELAQHLDCDERMWPRNCTQTL